MPKINILDSSVYNRIAAGEVVDRPYSVVKEFVENSIDAGAKNITVSIERGGKNLICVSDDGGGIEESDLRSAFLPHATSKISSADDLDAIHTLGFRGEALASIASVAKVRLRSKYRAADAAFEITCTGGALGEISPCALGVGTEIVAENLFYNTPVREKFMRTDKGEESEITNFVERFVLGNPHIAFRYFVDGKLVLQSFGGGLDEAVAAVYGASVISQCYRIDAFKHGVHIHGFIGRPDFTKANRTYQSTFVNGRYVSNNTVSSAISNAYASYLMKRQYPFYILFIDVPTEIVDVNVHPNKADVRFENNQVIYGTIYSVISAVLDGNANALEYIVGAKDTPAEPAPLKQEETKGLAETIPPKTEKCSEPAPFDREARPILPSSDPALKKSTPSVAAPMTDKPRQNSSVLGRANDPVSAQNANFRFSRPADESGGIRMVFHDSGSAALTPSEQENGADIFAENKRYLEELDRKAKQQKIIFDRAQYKGTLFNTYLLYEEGDDVYIIDQHAAHERLIFDRLKAEMDEREVVRQPMLVPYVLTVNAEEFAFLSEHLQSIADIGFDIEEFGVGSFKVSAVPLDLQEIDLSSFFNELLKDVGSLRAVKLSELLRDKIAMTACKHAVKGGMDLTESEKEKLFTMLHGDMGLKCPHGRPIAVKLTKYEIEKMFKRIV